MATTMKWLLAAAFNALTTEMNSQGSGTTVTSSVGGSSGVFSTTQTFGYSDYDVDFLPATGSNMTAGTVCAGYFLRKVDGTNYETLTAAQARNPDFIIGGMTAATTGHFQSLDNKNLPAEDFKVAFTNSTGVAFSASGSILTITPKTRQFV